ncbi:polyphosphate kinase 1 [Arachidicoccus ginsenosidivorans]|uniref:Polyphosphate kinase n=1 Tax=Arachidicoccus ginsenosidivorans TaxID=496057 RepID=A0A5B8VNW6_9BACT|nr:polyphosphate kinase 1 [Arachidicoccus ginsenosidivorans]QEC72602.1 polyphosphate kinase 1 [Arachidicoccus ginsenosidivorans]
MKPIENIPRDISWLSFNERVLQEASDPTVPLPERIKFLAIHSSNLEEFFRVRVAALKRMVLLKGKKANFYFEQQPEAILERIQTIVMGQQRAFNAIWQGIVLEMAENKIYLKDSHDLSARQKIFVRNYFDQEVASSVIPLLIEDLPALPYLRDKSLYLGVVMHKKHDPADHKLALIEIPSDIHGRFLKLPSRASELHIILLEDVIRFNLPYIFSFFDYDQYEAYIFSVTKDAEFDIDNDLSSTLVQKIKKGLKNRRKGKAVRFTYDKHMHSGLLQFLTQNLHLSQKDNILPGEKIHNFKDFTELPGLFPIQTTRDQPPFIHPDVLGKSRVSDVVLKKDLLLSLPYHSYVTVIDLLREAAMDPDVLSIQITAYRLATNSKIINALINAVRNGKEVTVMIELRARFNEQANLEWKERLEEEGVKTLIGLPDKKVHAKLCLIKKRVHKKVISYGFIATGNLNEKTARIYGDFYLLTANVAIMADIGKIFKFLALPDDKNEASLQKCKELIVAPTGMREHFMARIDDEIKAAKAGKKSGIILKLNSLSDDLLIQRLYEAAQAGVPVQMIIRSISCANTHYKKFKKDMFAISIVDEYLEHARVMIFHHGGKHTTYISSADWMVRNLQHRLEVAVKIHDPQIKKTLRDILEIQLSDNVKARILDGSLENKYIHRSKKEKEIRSQMAIYEYLQGKQEVLAKGGIEASSQRSKTKTRPQKIVAAKKASRPAPPAIENDITDAKKTGTVKNAADGRQVVKADKKAKSVAAKQPVTKKIQKPAVPNPEKGKLNNDPKIKNRTA